MSKVAEKKYPGEPVEIVNFGYKITGSKLQIDKKAFEKILSHESVIDRKISIISIVGAFRKGKSFFLGYCLRFLYTIYKSVGSPNAPFRKVAKYDWRGDKDEPLHGFSWKSGADRHTTGIIVWSDVFLYDSPNGDKVAILLMDTQGLFDNKSSPTENSRIFSLSTLISSMQIYNLHGQIQEDQLQYLQFATDIAKHISKGETSVEDISKPFQNLMFLIRDWQFPHDNNYGLEGGRDILNKNLKIEEDQSPDIKSLRQYLRGSFEDISCFLLPHPGKDVATKCDFDGRWSKIDDEFLKHLDDLIPNLLAPDNLKLKKINGEPITADIFYNCVVEYSVLFKSKSVPEVQTIFEATTTNHMNKLVKESMDAYYSVYTSENSELNDKSEILPLHKKAFDESLKIFEIAKKMGTKNHHDLFKNELEKQLMTFYTKWQPQALKNVEKIKEQQRKIAEATEKAQKAKNESESNKMEIEAITKQVCEAAAEMERVKSESEKIRAKAQQDYARIKEKKRVQDKKKEEAVERFAKLIETEKKERENLEELKLEIKKQNEENRKKKNICKWIWIPATILAVVAIPVIVFTPFIAVGLVAEIAIGSGISLLSAATATTALVVDLQTDDGSTEFDKTDEKCS